MGLHQSIWSILRLFFVSNSTKTTLPSSLSFAGQTILITGATSGLGLEAAILYVNLGAETVIITALTVSKGLAAKSVIESRSGKKNVVQVRVLDMDTFAGVLKFVKELEKEVTDIDIAFLNAGVHSFDYATLAEGWDADLQVNVLSTTLLALLLLPWMRSVCKLGQVQHLAVKWSGSHLDADISKVWPKKDVLDFWNKKENYVNGRNNYAVSKLLQQYAVGEIAKLAVDAEGRYVYLLFSGRRNADETRPSPIVTSICPGMIRTDITRSF